MKIAARAIIVRDHQIFLVKHKGRDFYSLPGGKINPDEGIKCALRREIFEELGINPKVGKMLFVHEFRYPKGDLSLEFFFMIDNPQDFTGELKGDFAEAELADLRWIDVDHDIDIMPKFLLEAIPSITSLETVFYKSELE